jgi:hypothetical protein
MSRIVVSLHGIRTRGVWQKVLAPILARHGFIPYLLDYGNFTLLPFLTPWSRKRKVVWLCEQMGNVYEAEGVRRVSIIAHSFGAYLTAQLIEAYPEFRFDKLILAAGIVREDFNWPKYFKSGQVNLVRNDYGRLDVWPSIAKTLIGNAGNSGRSGFKEKCKYQSTYDHLEQRQFVGHGHSDYFHIKHYTDYWIPVLKRTLAAPEDQPAINEKINLIVQCVAQELNMQMEDLRAPFFADNGHGRLEMPPGLQFRMKDPKERQITMDIGEGCAGAAYARRQPAIAIKRDGGWGEHMLPTPALAHLNRDLCWVISIPIVHAATGVLLGTLNIDGLRKHRTLDQLYRLTNVLYEPVQKLSSLMFSTL